MNIALSIPFFTLSNAEINFVSQELSWKLFTIAKALLITKQIELIEKKMFLAISLNLNEEIFLIHVAAPSLNSEIYPFYRVQLAFFFVNDAFTVVFSEYADFIDVYFLAEFAVKLSEYIEINNHPIDKVDGQQPPYRLIYRLKLIKLEILKTYIEINLVNSFIQTFKVLAEASIFFI